MNAWRKLTQMTFSVFLTDWFNQRVGASGNSSVSAVGPHGGAVMERDRAAKEDVGIPNKYCFLFFKKKNQRP